MLSTLLYNHGGTPAYKPYALAIGTNAPPANEPLESLSAYTAP
jgi:hypothetical protein